VLTLLYETWGHTPGAVGQLMIEAVDALLCTYGPQLDRGRFARALADVDPHGLLRRAREQRRLLDLGAQDCLAAELLKRYNHNLRSNRLVPLHNVEASTVAARSAAASTT
jgi:hypothetical protein